MINSNIGLSSIVIPVPFSVLEDGPLMTCGNDRPNLNDILGGASFRTRQDIFVLGQPRAFPNDWYELNDNVTVYVCTNGATQAACITQRTPEQAILPPVLPTSFIMMTRDEDLSMNVNIDNVQNLLEFTVYRSSWVIIYTYWVAAMPFVLMIGLFSVYVLTRKKYTSERRLPAVYEVAFGVAATLVAILPLRAVLVPSSLPNLTRLDIVFSTGVTLLVALSLAWVFVWTNPISPAPAGQGEGKPSDGGGNAALDLEAD